MNQQILNYLQKFIYFWIVCLVITSCSDNDQEPMPTPAEPKDQYLVDAQFIQSFEKDEILLLISLSGFQGYEEWIQYGVDVYRITYLTDYHNQTIEASGLLCVPKDLKVNAPLLAGLHGTILKETEAPSHFENGGAISGFEIFASLGFHTVIPDYLGFGNSEEVFHPYYDAYYTGRATTDMLLAVQEFLAKEELPYNDSLFITGYSEGGYAAVSTLKYIEENNLDFNVEATAAGAGGYNIMAMMESVMAQKVYNSPAYLVYIVYAYYTTHQWNRPLTDFFQEPYASQISTYMDGSLTAGQVNSKLPENIDQLFTAEFLQGIQDGTETSFVEALERNSVHNWAPQSPLRLYHEADDEIIPIANSEETYETMISQGAKQTAFFPYDDATSHGTGIVPMFKMVVPWFVSLL